MPPWTVPDDAERSFWLALERRICREFEGFADRDLRFVTCDGLIPDEYDPQAPDPCIRGNAYCGRSGQEVWRFTLLIGADTAYRAGVAPPGYIDWARLLPADDMTGWLWPDVRERTLVLDPLAARRD